jgi:hypothetical protein
MTMFELSRRSIAHAFVCVSVFASAWLGLPSPAQAETVIRHPGQHTSYSFELEPHLVLDWAEPHYSGTGIGPGVHFAIPVTQQGPISSINNNMAIKFGLDLTFGNGCYWYHNYYYYSDYCSTTSLTLPIALQWNFYITDIITTFGEVGMAIRHTWWSYDGLCEANRNCPPHHSQFYPIFYPAVGAKFMFGRTIGLTVRMGYPHFTVGASFLF